MLCIGITSPEIWQQKDGAERWARHRQRGEASLTDMRASIFYYRQQRPRQVIKIAITHWMAHAYMSEGRFLPAMMRRGVGCWKNTRNASCVLPGTSKLVSGHLRRTSWSINTGATLRMRLAYEQASLITSRGSCM